MNAAARVWNTSVLASKEMWITVTCKNVHKQFTAGFNLTNRVVTHCVYRKTCCKQYILRLRARTFVWFIWIYLPSVYPAVQFARLVLQLRQNNRSLVRIKERGPRTATKRFLVQFSLWRGRASSTGKCISPLSPKKSQLVGFSAFSLQQNELKQYICASRILKAEKSLHFWFPRAKSDHRLASLLFLCSLIIAKHKRFFFWHYINNSQIIFLYEHCLAFKKRKFCIFVFEKAHFLE